jgi:hypothetical protein
VLPHSTCHHNFRNWTHFPSTFLFKNACSEISESKDKRLFAEASSLVYHRD